MKKSTTTQIFNKTKNKRNTHLGIFSGQLLEQFRRTLPQRLTGLVQALLIPNVLPQLRRRILLQEPPGRVHAPDLIDNHLGEPSLLRLRAGHIGNFVLLDQRAEVFVAGVVVDEIAPAGQHVVLVRCDDALELRPRRVWLWVADGHRHGCVAFFDHCLFLVVLCAFVSSGTAMLCAFLRTFFPLFLPLFFENVMC